MNSATVQWIEVVWTLAALPGLVLWVLNRRLAGRSLHAIKTAGTANGRLIIARYGVMKADVFIGISGVFVLIGAISMMRPNPAGSGMDALRLVLTLGLIGAPAAISFLGYKWQAVEAQIVALARARLDHREVEQNTREATQNDREVEQNTRDKWQHGPDER